MNLTKKIKEHAIKGVGISNSSLNRFSRLLCNRHFKGVFPTDCIPQHLASQLVFSIIVNLGKSKGKNAEREGHFVSIVGFPKQVYYLDPYGLPPTQKHVKRFLKKCKRAIIVNRRQIQSLNSVYCGLFAVFFICYFDPVHNFDVNFFLKDLLRNDKLCIIYLRKIIDAIS